MLAWEVGKVEVSLVQSDLYLNASPYRLDNFYYFLQMTLTSESGAYGSLLMIAPYPLCNLHALVFILLYTEPQPSFLRRTNRYPHPHMIACITLLRISYHAYCSLRKHTLLVTLHK